MISYMEKYFLGKMSGCDLPETSLGDTIEAIETRVKQRFIVAMIPAKLSYFFYSAMVGSYAHYQNIFLRSIGLEVEETGFISGMTFVALAAAAPLWGILIDYTGRQKSIYFILFIGQVLCVVSQPFIASKISSKGKLNITMAVNRTANKTMFNSENVGSNSDDGTFSSSLFFAMLFIDIAAKICIAPLHAMIDAAVMNVIEVRVPQATFGEQRVFGSIGFAITSFLAGFLVDQCGGYFEQHNLSKYTMLFIVYIPIALINLPVNLSLLNQMEMSKVDDKKENKGNKTTIAFNTFRNLRNFIFLMTVCIVGFSSMIFAYFLFLLMKDKMDSSKTLMGISSSVQSAIQLLVFPFGQKLVHLCGGTVPALEIAVFSYVLRFVLTSYLLHPWLVIAAQTLSCAGFSLFMVAMVQHTKLIAPKEVYVTMFTIVNGMYYGVGGISANMIGGAVYGHFGADALFRGMGAACAIWTVLMILIFQVNDYMMKRRTRVQPID